VWQIAVTLANFPEKEKYIVQILKLKVLESEKTLNEIASKYEMLPKNLQKGTLSKNNF